MDKQGGVGYSCVNRSFFLIVFTVYNLVVKIDGENQAHWRMKRGYFKVKIFVGCFLEKDLEVANINFAQKAI